jgi:hypothetical protein
MQKRLTQSELAREHGVSHVAVAHWRKAGCPHRRNDKRILFEPAEVRAWLKQRERSKRRQEEIKLRKVNAQATLAELRLGVATGKLIPIEQVGSIVVGHLTNFRNRCLALGTRAAPLVFGLKDVKEVQGVLDDLFREAVGALDGTIEEIEALAPGKKQRHLSP